MDWSDDYALQTKNRSKTNRIRKVHSNPLNSVNDYSDATARMGNRDRKFYSVNEKKAAGINNRYEYRDSSLYYRSVKVLLSETSCLSTQKFTSGGFLRKEATDWMTRFPDMYTADLLLPIKSGYDPNLRNQAVVECTRKLSSNAVQYLTTLAEARKTVDHLADFVFKASKFILLAKKLRFSEAFSALVGKKVDVSDWASGWLEYNYAWKALAYDIQGTVEAFKRFDPEGMLLKAKRTTKSKFGQTWNGNSHDGQYKIKQISNYDYSYRVVILASVDDVFMRNLQKFSLDAPELTLWEIVPFSFVVDWLIPVGTFLEALNTSSKLNFVAASCTWYNEGTISGTFTRQSDWVSTRPGSYKIGYVNTQREPYTTWPRLKPYWKLPFSTSHVTSALALFHAANRQRFR